jgi:ParB family transcriptional regulator, chromosome partitioning protein
MPQLVKKLLSEWRERKQVRTTVDAEKDRQLTESIRQHGILQPPGMLPDGTGLFGHRRVRCGIAAGLTETLFYILDKPMTESEVRIVQATENLQRQDLTDAEIHLACKEIVALSPNMLKKDVAKQLGYDASWLCRALSPDSLIPAAREAFLGGAFGLGIAYEISKASSEQDQHRLLAARLAGATRDEIVREGRKPRTGTGQAVRVAHIRCPLASGATVQISGEGISLDDAIEAMSEALKAMRKAREDGLDSKTAQAVWRDKSKVGVT